VKAVSSSGRPLLLLTGAAAGLGASIAGTFAAAGHDVLGLARSNRSAAHLARVVGDGGGAYAHLTCDITRPAEVADALRPHVDRIGVLVHNAAALLIKPFEETTAAEFEQVWRVACFGAFVASRIVVPHMVARKTGTVILTGATAALRGGPKFAAFASAKFALRGLAQSLSREFGPQGVHVAHVVLDGLIDEAQTDRRFGPAQATRMDPDAVAGAYLALATQHRSAWTHELDLRPLSERF
jgi:NAD(P)-dependent dehydrogenase (short-subunit alcohol dehydrogenase family)